MLVLTRKKNEQILCDGGPIVIRVVAVEGGRVKLGIIAPRDVNIVREEVKVRTTAAA